MRHLRLGVRDPLVDPLFTAADAASSLRPRDGLSPAVEVRFAWLEQKIHAAYLDRLRQRLAALFAACRVMSVRFIVFSPVLLSDSYCWHAAAMIRTARDSRSLSA